MSTTPQIQSSTPETKHTPGPYGLTPESSTVGCFVISGPLHKHIKVAAILPLADHAEFVANARLFSAAPELLACVRKFLCMWAAANISLRDGPLNEEIVKRYAEINLELVDRAMAAVAKAEKGGL